jgi:hypothetical protein
MNAWLRRLFEPASTSATDAFTWNDKRSKAKQVANGFRIAGGWIAGFVVIVLAFGSIVVLSEDQPTQSGISVLASWVALVVATLIMLWTANRWAPFLGFFFGPAVLKILGILAVGDDSYYSSHSITRVETAEVLAYFVVVVSLTSRFIGTRPAPTTVFDRLALTFFVFTSFKQAVIPYRFPPWFLISGVVALFAAWCVHRFTRVKRKRRHKHGVDAPASSVGP